MNNSETDFVVNLIELRRNWFYIVFFDLILRLINITIKSTLLQKCHIHIK